MRKSHLLWGLGAGAALIGGTIFLVKTSFTGNNLNVTINRIFYKSGLGNPVYGLNLTISNPTTNSITITRPELKAYSKGIQIGNSIPSTQVYTIKPKSSVEIKDLNVQMDGIALARTIPDTITYIRNKIKGAAASITIELEILVNVNGLNQTIRKQVKI